MPKKAWSTSRTCAHQGCSTRSTFGVVGTKKLEFCSGHAAEGMIDLNNKKRAHRGRSTCRASFGVAGNKKPELLRGEHVTESVTNLSNIKKTRKQCVQQGCKAVDPSYGEAGTKKREFCREHARKGMINLRPMSVQPPAALSRRVLAQRGSRSESSAGHALEGMIYVTSRKKRARKGCTTPASYGVAGSKRGGFWKKHAKQEILHFRIRKRARTGGSEGASVQEAHRSREERMARRRSFRAQVLRNLGLTRRTLSLSRG